MVKALENREDEYTIKTTLKFEEDYLVVCQSGVLGDGTNWRTTTRIHRDQIKHERKKIHVWVQKGGRLYGESLNQSAERYYPDSIKTLDKPAIVPANFPGEGVDTSEEQGEA